MTLGAANIEKALDQWLDDHQNGSDELLYAIDKTISEGLFPESDVLHAVNHLRSSVLDAQPSRWLDKVKSEFTSDRKTGSRSPVLCLHAGNLPFVGFQDVLAVLLSGRPYAGKLSRKDPWLIQSFLEVLKKVIPQTELKYSTALEHFANEQFDTWMFAGSETGLTAVESELQRLNIIRAGSRALRRTAHFSVAVLPDISEGELTALCEAMFRYGGRGCRSVAIVYSDSKLSDVGNDLIRQANLWFKENRYPTKPGPAVLYRHAYNLAVGIPSVLTGTHLIQAGIPSPDYPEIIYWQPMSTTEAIRQNYGSDLQEIFGRHTPTLAPIIEAQRPPIEWSPDGIDTLEWLFTI
jgi:hypothetical protein